MYTIGLSTSFTTYKNYYAVDPIFAAYHISKNWSNDIKVYFYLLIFAS
jgi:hypothetical protein